MNTIYEFYTSWIICWAIEEQYSSSEVKRIIVENRPSRISIRFRIQEEYDWIISTVVEFKISSLWIYESMNIPAITGLEWIITIESFVIERLFSLKNESKQYKSSSKQSYWCLSNRIPFISSVDWFIFITCCKTGQSDKSKTSFFVT